MKAIFEFTEQQYQDFIAAVQQQNKIELTQFETGLCRALLDIRKRLGNKSGAAIGSRFKTHIFVETAEFINEMYKKYGEELNVPKSITEKINRLKN